MTAPARPIERRRRHAIAVASLAAGVCLAACTASTCTGSGSTGSTDGGARQTAASVFAWSGDCSVITPTDIKTITGADVLRIDRDPARGAGGTCLNFATTDGEVFLGVDRLASRRDYDASLDAALPRTWPTRETLPGLGEEAVLLRGPSNRRCLMARKGDSGVALFPTGTAARMSDRALHQLAIRALARLP